MCKSSIIHNLIIAILLMTIQKKQKYYPEVESNANFPEIERVIIEFWKKNSIFEQSVANPPQADGQEFTFYDGPPFANGLPHYGHLLTGFVKDLYARYQTTKGKRVERRFGWDCHGLPAEMGAEKELDISGRIAITKYGINKFNDTCRTSVMQYSNEWEKYVTRQARFVDFQNSYKTMDINFMRMLSDGPEVSLKGSPTVSPTTAALWASDPFPPR